MGSIIFTAIGQIERQQAINIVLNDIVNASIGKVNVYLCSTIKHPIDSISIIDRTKVSPPDDSDWVFFIDDHPICGWAHPSRLIFVNVDDGIYTIYNENFYPDSLLVNFEIVSQIILPNPISFLTDSTIRTPLIPPSSHKYAVIITGNDDRLDFWYNTSIMYNTLENYLGYKKEHIILHYCDGHSNQTIYQNNFDGPSDPPGDISYPAHFADISNTFDAMAGTSVIPGIPQAGLGPEDILFIYVDCHGENFPNGNYYFMLPDHDVTSIEFTELLQGIKCSQMIIVMQPCHSGGFGPVLTDYINFPAQCTNRVVQTACNGDEKSWPELYITTGSGSLRTDEFSYYLNAALRGYYPDPNEPWKSGQQIGFFDFSQYPFHYIHPLDYNPDTYNPLSNPFGNTDGIIQMSEAFAYMDNFDTWSHSYPVTGFGYFDPEEENQGIETPQQWITSGFESSIIPNTNNSCYQGDLNTLSGLSGRIDNSQIVENRNYVVGGKLIVNDESSVIMDKGTYYMCPSTKLQILPGGNLTLDSTHFTTNNYSYEIPEYWDGIEVLGNYTLSQIPSSNQGKITLTNGTKIENANTAIFVGMPLYPSFAGGIVHCDSAYFINNIIASRFDPYQFTENSYFTHTNFLTTQTPLPNGEYPDYFIKLYGVSSVRFNGCSFTNTQEVINNYIDRGNGILSNDSRFLISEYCLSNESPCIHKRQSVFQNLNRGIYATNTGSILSPEIINTFFYDNVKGLYMSGFTGIASPSVLSNSFRVYRPGLNPTFDSYGMYLDQCSGFHIEDNSFFTNGLTPNGIGLIANNCGGEPNRIYRNIFTNLSFGSLAQNINRDNRKQTGLCYKCNNFSLNTTDIAVTKDPGLSTPDLGIAPSQGSTIPDPGFIYNTAPAGNTFSATDIPDHYDINNSLNSFVYYHHAISEDPNARLIPNFPSSYILQYSTQPVSGTNYSAATSCPSTINTGGGQGNEDLLIESGNKRDSLESILATLIDGGSTAALAMDVQNSTPPEALPTRNELISNSPYLSDSVMKVATGKEDVLDNAMIRDILVANPQSAKSDEIINSLENRTTQMPSYMMEQILEGENIVGAKEIQEAQKAYWEGEHWFAYQNLINLYKGDSIITNNADSIVTLLETENTLVSSYDLASWHYNTGDPIQAQNILNSIPSLFSLSQEQHAINQDYINLYEVKQQISNNPSGPYILDTTQISALQDIAINDPDIPGVFARNMLLASNNIQYNEPIFLPDDGLKSSKIEKYRGVKTNFDNESSFIKVFPNPAKDFFIAEYHLPSYAQNANLLITDQTGKKLMNIPLNYSEDQKVIQTTDLISGIYQVSLFIDGKVKGNSKIDLIK